MRLLLHLGSYVAGLALFGAPVSAQIPDTVFELEEVRVEISRLRVGGIPLLRAPLSAQVLQGTDLRQASHATVADALAWLPGVTLVDQFGSPFQPDIRLRGFSLSPVVGLPQSLSVFVDGVRVNEADASQVHFDLIPTDDIERLEVIRGPIGPFGKNTLAGALNIVTRRGMGPPSAEVELSGGYYDELKGRGRIQGQSGTVDYYGGVGYYRSRGWRDKNHAEQLQAFGKLGWRGEKTDFQISYTFADDSIEAPGSLPESWLAGGELPPDITSPPGDRRELQYTGGRGDYFLPRLHFVNANIYQRLDDRWSLQANAYGRFVDFEQFNDNITECDALGLTDISSGGSAVQLSHRRDRDLIATIGAEYVRNEVDIEILELPNPLPECVDIDPAGERTELVGTDEDNLGVYSELWWALNPAFSVHGSVRFDHVVLPFKDLLDPAQSGDNEFNQLTGTVGVDYLGASGFGAFASYGRGFRAPVILEISCADPEDPCPLPFELGADPPLDPVKTDTWQLGLRYARGAELMAEVVGYWSEVYDDIFNVIDPQTPTRGFFTNLDKTRRQGVELSVVSAPLPEVRELTLSGTFAWTRATFQSPATLAAPFLEEEEGPPAQDGEEGLPAPEVEPGDKFPIVPEVTFTLGARYSPSGWDFGLDGRFVGSQFLVGDEDNTESFGMLDRYFLLDGYVERRIGPVTLYLRGQNLLDSEYETFGIISENVRVGPNDEEEVERFLTPGYPFRLFGGISYRFQ